MYRSVRYPTVPYGQGDDVSQEMSGPESAAPSAVIRVFIIRKFRGRSSLFSCGAHTPAMGDLFAPDPNSWPAKLVVRVGKTFRSNKSFTQAAIEQNKARDEERRRKRREAHAAKNHYKLRDSHDTARSGDDLNELGERDYTAFSDASTLVDHRDNTDMLHRLAHHDSFDSLVDSAVESRKLGGGETNEPHLDKLTHVSTRYLRMVESLPGDLWQRVAGFLNPTDAALLALSSHAIRQKLGPAPFQALNLPQNKHYRIAFLHSMDHQLPDHLLCFPCGRYHRRSLPGRESLKADYVNHPVIPCPQVKTSVLPRMRLCHARELPYAFVQLALRQRHGKTHGIPHEALDRRWSHAESGWSFRSRYMMHDNRLLLRVVSQRVVPPARMLTKTVERHILYDREEYTPYFSVCAHWRDGDLMDLCKCALSHVPAPPESYFQQLKKAPKISRAAAHPCFLVRGCDWCRPARRCPECPTEYLIHIQMVEDKHDPAQPFKHAIVVTRWSDLGDGSSPYTSPEWAAINGITIPAEEGGHEYESFSHIGRRAVSGIVESKASCLLHRSNSNIVCTRCGVVSGIKIVQSLSSHALCCSVRWLFNILVPRRVTPSSSNAIQTPDDAGHKQRRGCTPRQNQEPGASYCTDAEVIAVMVDQVHRFDSDCRGNGACDSNHNKRQPIHQHVEEGTYAALEEEADQGQYKRKTCQANADAIEYEHYFGRNVQRMKASVDGTRPLQVLDIDGAMSSTV
ncbi:hypothetical protein BAUCODRAFT_26794 [Baudoinia panamericana UAMH 10762]|uniref:F-box domain-containing protein n=1 Tax=Baudoinia panamericana (strain UAMH 10762) TaxID=717646 RepID=M2MAQ1_BAUPA|nr:uncharacterized protein BAUCODRAFT_26794 [Baudoinia panamericana UAMH 10762]EMC93526.1 hypothetical protein BAUCODRAFT_26794 [Baudoinia panamericana UAMH 10762]